MPNPDGVLDAIDACLRDSLSPDAMRWAPDEPEPTLDALRREAIVTTSAFSELQRAAQAALEGFGKAFAPFFSATQAALHRAAHSDDRKHYRHCPTCNPRGFPKPLAIDGHEYHRRQRRRNKR